MQQKPTAPNSVWRIPSDELPAEFLPDDGCLSHGLPVTLGHGQSKIFKLDRDLSYIETQYSPKRNLAVLSRMDTQQPRMVVTLGLKGRSRFATNQHDGVVFKQGYTTITTFNSSDGYREYEGDQPVTQLRFSMNQDWLERHFGVGVFSGIFQDKSMRVISHQPISAATIIAARSLLGNSVAVKARPLFRQGQAMAILASELSHLLGGDRQRSARITQRDRQIADLARDILSAEFKSPPSVEELCRRVGTNQFKLKQLFHQCFSTTPYGLLLDIRMEKAYQLLKSSHCPVGIAAESVGYQHASNFSAAFAKYFGFPPKQLCRRE
ncbi:helix-turn-helix transcriptional regulator [Methylomonas sp. LL1]|uniref:helix-turn-helix transcriptional regulator n=1 Tax=Methylomonas sp. LL1 TaxID=2785785 RepID=UPI0018C37CCC|nr:AraC family transcriptional regulator [Methylomonas sp. LL1]QPK62988.1 helix-turn-helix transcriptional regulator [Methylomonas sp. LL1]